MVSARFELATLEVKKVTGSIPNDDLLLLYAYYKIATGEDFSKATAPSTFDFKGKYKYNAWKKEVDAKLTPADAEKKYIELAGKLREKHGFDASVEKSANGEQIKDADLKRFDELVKETGTTY
ncbi:MAG: hypothetical protein GOMPHAMPRED_006494 [Gomphillus americanus]|uniref:ACB domain-containing protein n=1 Tax=Gomphillus americanus TaxID=1940652 RepID=A0A8H3G019_9LECA|nr:MAG: hypothetical protein GOMPHAMPRED_006494 [Gomphillus americanus]